MHPKRDGVPFAETSSQTGGPWSVQESQNHMNWLELRAAFLAVQCFAKDHQQCHIQLYIDNTVTIAYINQMGGTHSRKLCHLALQLWDWCMPSQSDHSPCRAHTWKCQCDSRPRIKTHLWLKRLEAEQNNLSVTAAEVQPIHSGSVCIISAENFLQLEAQSNGDSSGWKHHNSYMFPPFALICRAL